MNEQSSVGRAANGQEWKVRNHSSEKEGWDAGFSPENSASLSPASFLWSLRALRERLHYLLMPRMSFVYFYNVADLLVQPLP